MKLIDSQRGFRVIEDDVYPPNNNLDDLQHRRIVQESSAIGQYDDSFDSPGSSFLWFGRHHHLNREEVAVLVNALEHWLDHKRLPKELTEETKR